jgi:hypothetical protein
MRWHFNIPIHAPVLRLRLAHEKIERSKAAEPG